MSDGEINWHAVTRTWRKELERAEMDAGELWALWNEIRRQKDLLVTQVFQSPLTVESGSHQFVFVYAHELEMFLYELFAKISNQYEEEESRRTTCLWCRGREAPPRQRFCSPCNTGDNV